MSTPDPHAPERCRKNVQRFSDQQRDQKNAGPLKAPARAAAKEGTDIGWPHVRPEKCIAVFGFGARAKKCGQLKGQQE
jgi:hypothetical protein